MPSWKERALAATRGSRFGAILSAATGTEIEAPCFHGKANVTSDGFVMADFTGSDGRYHMGAFVGAMSDLEANVSGLANHLDLNDDERAELYATVHGWVGRDYRKMEA